MRQLGVGGDRKTKYINCIGLTITPIYSTIILYDQGLTLQKATSYLLPFFVMVVIILITKGNKYVTAFVYLFMAVGTSIDPTNITDYSGMIYFAFSFQQIKNKYYGIAIILITCVCLTLRSVLFEDTIPQAVLMLIAFAYLYALYYRFNIHESVKNHTKVEIGDKIEEANPTNVKIMQMRCLGYSWSKINDILKLNITDQAMCARISRERNKFNFETPEQYVYWLMLETCKKTQNSDSNNIENKIDDIVN